MRRSERIQIRSWENDAERAGRRSKNLRNFVTDKSRSQILNNNTEKHNKNGKKGASHCECGEPVIAVIGGKDGPHPSVGKLEVRSVW